ncbi:MAG: N-acetyltransferase, partial [Chloroflexota bacterium]
MSVQLVQPSIKPTMKPTNHARAVVTAPVTSARLRMADANDVGAIAGLINHYAALGQMLPRKEESVFQNLREFIVVEAQQQVVACGALHHWDDESAEVRSLAVAAEYAGQGLGKQIVNRLLDMGAERNFTYAFALTLQVRFFEKLKFEVVKKSVLPQKIWGDCIICPFLYNCHETA